MMHSIIWPILLPIFTAALLLLPWWQSNLRLRRTTSGLSLLLLVASSFWLLWQSAQGERQLYLLGDWPEPYGILLVADRLSAFFVMITSVLALAVWSYSCGGDDEKGAYFQPLLHCLLMGLNGAFLTGDLFNLFVFFEVLLISSYGLLVHGGGKGRIRASLHYVLLNLIGSAIFLLALAMLYSMLGSLHMADMAARISTLSPEKSWLVQSAAAMLLVVFGLKGALLPFHFWLLPSYSQANPVVAALFAIMTKVGIYALLRVFTQLFGANAGNLAGFGTTLLWWGGLLTMLVAVIGLLASQDLRRLTASLVLLSAGLLLTSLSMASAQTTAALLWYAMHSTWLGGAMFLLGDAIARQRGAVGDRIVAGKPMFQGRILAIGFSLLALSAIGMPPFSGSIAKIWLLQSTSTFSNSVWFWGAILISSLAVLIAMSRAGTTIFWRVKGEAVAVETLTKSQLMGLLLLILPSIFLVIFAEGITKFCLDAALQLHGISQGA